MEIKSRVYNITELTRVIKSLLEPAFADIWVTGEISNFKHHTSGHMYFTLKDENSALRAAMFRNDNVVLKFKPDDGMQVLAHGRISIYEKNGNYQMYVDTLEPSGIGALQLAFEQMKEKLEKEGLFDPEHKKPIPVLPERIGVITSPTGAAIQDIVSIITRRFPGAQISIYPVRVQGQGSADEIAEAIEAMNGPYGIDVLILARGGGSIEDLWSFNEEKVARAIYASGIPVISAVGHETDFTIADFVSDLRAPTPSAAAELVIKTRAEFLSEIESLSDTLNELIKWEIAEKKKLLIYLETRLKGLQPSARLKQFSQALDEFSLRLKLGIEHFLAFQKQKLSALLDNINSLSPLKILARGYSIALKLPEKQIIKNTEMVQSGDDLEIKLHLGKLLCRVNQVLKEENNG